jgi:hypothetical protein
MVCALLGLAVAVLYDVARAPGPAVALIETPVVIIGLDRLRRMADANGHALGMGASGIPRLRRRPRGTPTYFETLPDVTGELELRPAQGRQTGTLPAIPSVIVEE